MPGEEKKDNMTARNAASVRNENTVNHPTYVPIRILWPALGFPAVIDPDGDDPGTDCIHILFLTTVPKFYNAAKVVAKHLRYVPWDKRHMRRMDPSPTCSFEAKDIKVRPVRHLKDYKDERTEQYYFAENSILGGLASFVRDFYRRTKPCLKYMYQAQISQDASKRLQAGKYHLFWNNKKSGQEFSDEMQHLLDGFAKKRVDETMDAPSDREWPKGSRKPYREFLNNEYKYEYGAIHPPYSKKRKRSDRPYTEVLHPLFVRSTKSEVKIGHLTDLHIHVRADVYEENLRRAWYKKKVRFNNWNRSAEKLYLRGGNRCDLLLLTGDLIDFGRGHLGLTEKGVPAASLGDDGAYHRDRNWMLFYYLLCADDAYKQPSYTILGNHDWRINPYPPFAIAGAPGPKNYVHNWKDFNSGELKEILRLAHGPGHETSIAYDENAVGNLLKDHRGAAADALFGLFKRKNSADLPGLPTETNIDSVAWYLLLINPFLDYAFSYPGGYKFVMLDWGEDEYVIFRTVHGGVEYLLAPSTDGGPRASNSLSSLQKRMVQWFLMRKSNAKIMGIHSPVVAPWPQYTDDMLKTGYFKQSYSQFKKDRGRGSTKQITGESVSHGHAIVAFTEKGDSPGAATDYGTIAHNNSREWLIRELREIKDRWGSGLQPPPAVVFSGHNHRSNLLVVEEPSFINKGKMLVKTIDKKDVGRVSYFGADGKPEMKLCAPLYLNTTSAGPRGNKYPSGGSDGKSVSVDPAYAEVELSSDGTIRSVEFKTG